MCSAFDEVRRIGLGLRGVEAGTKYDGSPVLRVDGVFVAGLAMHASAEPDTLVVRCAKEDRARLLEEAPETYYVTEYYRRHPVVLVRLGMVGEEGLRDLLRGSCRMARRKNLKLT
jgi:hypothetical protein